MGRGRSLRWVDHVRRKGENSIVGNIEWNAPEGRWPTETTRPDGGTKADEYEKDGEDRALWDGVAISCGAWCWMVWAGGTENGTGSQVSGQTKKMYVSIKLFTS